LEANIKRLSLLFFILLTALLLVACSIFESPELKNEAYFPAVVFSEDGAAVSIYVDGQAPVSPNIALTKSLAVMGRDFFVAKVISAVSAPMYQYPLLH